ncbi:peptidylprolyl isomerase FPR3 NDAI_0D03160 [Naumovozyma dairenensis CBS 421]|uniref:FK506-binding protein n=1 Tax=Naumovozyma dairenensis (strain ATCC 10597 / BCRC 20456 / CBS 421 / NBRC 0211 / NRRL Y-12639) TaxID=1071378 RepID=G0WA19_NAUDC|nr:hypothetical protein NDAI_0D03160 [Naumovozyma dairenensis CBS 421]CCD24630.1 hypothetical protein NDAI_0D03160 [Naumovozyma dairenensis CBS 421]
MTDMLPLATYNLNIEPYTPTPAIDIDMPVTIRITMAALNPEAYDKDKTPSTLRVIKRNPDYNDGDIDDVLNGDFDEDEMDDASSEEEEEEEKETKKSKTKKSKKEEESEEDSEDEDDIDDEFEEFVLVTLSPKSQFQQALDITIAPEEDVQFVVTGSYSISLSGNYVKHPFDTPMMDDEDEHEDEEDYDSEEDDEEYSSAEDDLDDISDEEVKIEEIEENEEEIKKESKKETKNKKRKQEEEAKAEAESNKSKRVKKVDFKKDLEEGPTKKKDEKPKAKVLEGGIMIEDRVVGKGPQVKKGSKIGMRYIGKLKNGKVFDKNTNGKPFSFKLGHGEVIKGWDIGVAGMAVGGERRIIIPAPYAYGKQALPGIPANSQLTFDVKLVSMK